MLFARWSTSDLLEGAAAMALWRGCYLSEQVLSGILNVRERVIVIIILANNLSKRVTVSAGVRPHHGAHCA